MLALTFVNPEDYDKIRPSDKVSILGLESFAPGKNLTLLAKHEDGSKTVRSHSLPKHSHS
jgi:aconitate hydratase